MLYSRSNMFPEFYTKILEHILEGNLCIAEGEIASAYLDSIENKDYLKKHENTVWLKLLECRIQFQKNGTIENVLDSYKENNTNITLLAEVYFVSGLIAFYSEDFIKGVENFSKAAGFYRQMNLKKRELLSEYNVYIGKATIDFDWSGEEQIVFLNSLAAKAYLISDHHLLSIIYRQRSLVYKELSKYQAAIEDSLKALDLLLGTQNHSDAQGVYLNLCDIYLDLNEPLKAQLYYEKIITPIDPRHAFALAYINARLNNITHIMVSDFSFICPHYKKRVSLCGISLEVEESLQDLTESERRLLVLLRESPRRKTDLVKLIWPEKVNPKSLDNRLYQLIFRVNKKSKYRIQKNLGLYVLASGT